MIFRLSGLLGTPTLKVTSGRLCFVGRVYGAEVKYAWFTLEANFVQEFLYNQGGLAPRIEEGIRFDGSLGVHTSTGST